MGTEFLWGVNKNIKLIGKLGVVACNCSPSTQEAEPCQFKDSLVYIMLHSGQPGIHRESLSKKKKKKPTKPKKTDWSYTTLEGAKTIELYT